MNPERLQLFFDMSMSLLVTADGTTGRFIDLNPAWETTLGWTLDELRSRPFVEFCHPDDVAPTNAIVADMIERGLPAVNFENRYQHKAGHWVWLSWVGLVSDGMFVSAARDITEYKLTLQALEQANDELRQFGYAASHDLREPLRTIQGHISHIDATALAPQNRQSFEYVLNAVERMKDMLDAILAYSHVEAEGSSLVYESVEVALAYAQDVLAAAIEESDARIEHTGVWPTLVMDVNQIAAVFQNLLGNAIKYRRPGVRPKIIVASTRGHSGWRFEVRDNGVGFDGERAGRAFQIFQRLHRRSLYDGMGVGLALVKRIVQRHGGEVGIESEPGVGTTAWFWLPETRGVLP